jgi:hypothetical protein
MDTKERIKNITPFIILAVIAVICSVYFLATHGTGPEGVGLIPFGSVVVMIGIMLLVDVLLKRVVKMKSVWVWVVEALLLLAFIYYLIVA